MDAKLIGVEFALDSACTAMEIHSAAGLFPDLPVDRYLRDAFHVFAPAGTSDVQLIRLAEEAALGTDRGTVVPVIHDSLGRPQRARAA